MKLRSNFCPNVNHLELLFNLFFLTNVPILIPQHCLICRNKWMDQTPIRSLAAESYNQYVEVVRQRIKFNTPFRPQIYSHSSFPNVRYVSNHSKYQILYFVVPLNPSNYRTFSDFQFHPSTSTGENFYLTNIPTAPFRYEQNN